MLQRSPGDCREINAEQGREVAAGVGASTESRRLPGDKLYCLSLSTVAAVLQRSPGDCREINAGSGLSAALIHSASTESRRLPGDKRHRVYYYIAGISASTESRRLPGDKLFSGCMAIDLAKASTESRRLPGDKRTAILAGQVRVSLQRSPGDCREINTICRRPARRRCASTESRRLPGDKRRYRFQHRRTQRLQRSPGDCREINRMPWITPSKCPCFNGVPAIAGR